MSRSYKNTVIAVLLACILTMAIGYAVLNTRLSISGTSKITSDFNIQVTGISEFKTEQLAKTADMDYTPTSATFSTNLQAPGDAALYEIVIENLGTIPGYVEFEERFNSTLNNNYPYEVSENVTIGVLVVTTEKLDVSNINITTNQVDPGVNMIDKGEKLYVYTFVEFNESATSLPESKNFDFSCDFIFSSALNNNGSVNDNESIMTLANAILEDTVYVDYGTGLRRFDGYTYFISDENNDVNNYVNINGKLWRVVKFDYTTYNYESSYFLIEADDVANTYEGYSSVADGDGFYNTLYDDGASLLVDIKNTVYNYGYFKEMWTNNYDYNYVENTELFSDSNDTEGWKYTKHLIGINDIMLASSSSNCTFANLSSGGCKSWLTNNGDTYLFNKLYNSDKTTNTGKIGYLQDNKIIGVDPQDANYGEYKIYTKLDPSCANVFVNNANTADGSKSNPYVLIMDQLLNPPLC